MAEIKSSGTFEAVCQHEHELVCTLLAGKLGGDKTAVGKHLEYRCGTCGAALYPIVNGRSALEMSQPLTTIHPDDWPGAKKKTQPPAKPQPDPSLARSNIRRDGLKAGETAPEFRLPLLARDQSENGAEAALADYRGKRLLLVFIHSKCQPCEQIAPDLQRLHERGFHVLAINNKNPDDARSKVAKLGTTFPVAMQKEWEISKAYAMFATPMAYLIGPDGVIERDVAVGVEPIRELIKGFVSQGTQENGVNQ